MITITCPDCGTRYAVADTTLADADKRRLRCANCGLVWEHVPAPTAAPAEGAPGEAVTPTDSAAAAGIVMPLLDPALADPAVAGPAPVDAASPAAPTPTGSPPPALAPEPRPSVTAQPPARRRHQAVWAAAIGLLVLLAGLALIALVGRERIEARFPATRPLYGLALADAAPPGSGLKVTVTPMRRADALVIAGDIVNGAERARPVPRLRLTLLDNNKTNLDSKIIEPPVAQLSPGAKAHFNTTFEHPASEAVRVDVTFAD